MEGSFVLHISTKKVGEPSRDYFADGDYNTDAWQILNPDAEGYSVVTGEGIVMPTQRYDIYSTGAAWKNCFVSSQPPASHRRAWSGNGGSSFRK